MDVMARRKTCSPVHFLPPLLGAALVACTSISAPPPEDQLASARASVAQAEPAAVKEAPRELHAAQTKLARAEDSMERGEYERARRLAEQAEVDAKLAWAAAETARMGGVPAEAQPAKEYTLQEARDSFRAASDDPQVQLRASVELAIAERTLREAEDAGARSNRPGAAAQAQHLAYLAAQRARLAVKTAEYRHAEAVAAISGHRRQ
jgi:hypothetical protein